MAAQPERFSERRKKQWANYQKQLKTGHQLDPGAKRAKKPGQPYTHLKGGGYDIVEHVPAEGEVETAYKTVPKRAGSAAGQALHHKYYPDAVAHIYHLAGYGAPHGKRWDAPNPKPKANKPLTPGSF